MLGAFGHPVATCWVLLAQIWPFSNLSQQHPTCRNTSQHGGQTHTTCWSQQCWDMLFCHVAIVWPGLYICRYLIIHLGGERHCDSEEHNTMIPVRGQVRSTRSGIQRAYHESVLVPGIWERTLSFAGVMSIKEVQRCLPMTKSHNPTIDVTFSDFHDCVAKVARAMHKSATQHFSRWNISSEDKIVRWLKII